MVVSVVVRVAEVVIVVLAMVMVVAATVVVAVVVRVVVAVVVAWALTNKATAARQPVRIIERPIVLLSSLGFVYMCVYDPIEGNYNVRMCVWLCYSRGTSSKKGFSAT
eukprot:comp22067_c0_seq1/m.32135 comp22067_c0_seq1/g.32135  ORF comp22067_c0_seq1/g.32135 comp22067_c0_seq1/m.32135 type:complete len:108 (+) comp22067_c0_seq1:2849-3172(+)